jgi:N-acetylneuraminic acid mutarotase
VKSSKVADDGTVFTGPPWRSLPELGGTPSLTVAAAHDGSVLAFRGGLQLLTTQPPPWMQVLDASGGAWNPAVPSGAQVSAVLGVSGGSLYALGRTTTGASLLRFNAALSRWDAVGPAPTFSNLRGGAALANGELVALDTPGLSQMVMYIYSPVTGSWRKGATYSSTILRPAIAAVDNDVYVIGGYRSRSSSNGITGTVRRYRPLMNTWENLTVTMPTPRDDAVAVAVGGKLYVIGGWGETIDVPKGRVVEIFDTATGAWSAGPVLPQSRDTFGAAALDGRIYVIGGRNSENAWVNSGFVLLP